MDEQLPFWKKQQVFIGVQHIRQMAGVQLKAS